MSRRSRRRDRFEAVDEDVSIVRSRSLEAAAPRRGKAATSAAVASRASVSVVRVLPEAGDARPSSVEAGSSTSGELPLGERPPHVASKSGGLSLGSFTGENTSLATHLAKWRNCAVYHNWDEKARVCQLKGSLDGPASQIWWQIADDCSEAELLELLQSRFGNSNQVELFRSELRSRRRRRNESLQSLYNDVCRLLALSFPGDPGMYDNIMARDAFINCLDDEELRLHILDRGAQTIAEAYAITMRYESYRGGRTSMSEGDESNRRRVRAVQQPVETAASEISDRRVEERLSSAFDRRVDQLESTWRERWARLEASLATIASEGERSRSLSQRAGPRDAAAGTARSQSGEVRNRDAGRTGPERSKRQRQRGCYGCGSSEHFVRDCPRSTDRQGDSSSSAHGATAVPRRSQPTPVLAVVDGKMVPRTETCLPIRFRQGSEKFVNTLAVLDTGSNQCLLPAKYAGSRLQPCEAQLIAANGTGIATIGRKRLIFELENGMKLTANFSVSDEIDEIILSRDWMAENEIDWKFGDTLCIRGRRVELKPRSTVINVRRVIASENVQLEPRSYSVVPVNLAVTRLEGVPSNYILEPKLINDSALVARSLFGNDTRSGVYVLNPTDQVVKIKKWQPIGNADAVFLECRICTDGVCMCQPNKPLRPVHDVGAVRRCQSDTDDRNKSDAASDADVELIKPVLDSLPDFVTVEQRSRVRDLLLKYVDIFARHEYDVGDTNLVQCKLQLKDPRLPPIAEAVRAHPVAYLDQIDEEVQRLCDAGIVTPCSSTWAANLVVVPKKDLKDGKPRLRITLDARRINQRLHRLAFPMPRSDQIFNSLCNKRLFNVLDMANAYLSVPLSPDTDYIASFVTRRGQFKFVKMVAGLSSAGSLFNQLIMQRVFNDMCWSDICCFVDDLICPCSSVDEGMRLIEEIFKRIRFANLKLKPSKCKLFQTEVRVLGHIVSENSIKQDPQRFDVIKSIPFPRNVHELRKYLGFCNFARQYCKGYAEIAQPLFACLKKGARVEETPVTREAFDRLRELMISSPTLAMFDTQAPETIVEVDASGTACGGALYQVGKDGAKRIVAYFSQTFTPQEQARCVTHRELVAIVKAVKKWRCYLLGRRVKIISDHSCLKYLYTCRNLSPQWSRMLEYLEEFDLDINWTAGKNQHVSDFLSRIRRPCETGIVATCLQCRPGGPAVGRRREGHGTRVFSNRRMDRVTYDTGGRWRPRPVDFENQTSGVEAGRHEPPNTASAARQAARAVFDVTDRSPSGALLSHVSYQRSS